MQKNEAEVFSRPNVDAKIHDFEQYTLWQPTPGRPRMRSRMSFGERNGAARVTVFTNLEEGPKILFVGIHPDYFYNFLSQAESVAKGPNDRRFKMDNYIKADQAGSIEDANNRVVKNSLWFGKDAEGICWIAIEQKDSKNIRFTLEVGEWHALYIVPSDGSAMRPMTPSEASVARTLGFITGLRKAFGRFSGRIKPPYEKPTNKKQADTGVKETAPSTLSSFDNDDILY